MIAIIDYGMGNLRSVQAGFEHIGQKVFITDKPREVLSADGVVLPGVGAFGDAIKRLNETGLGEAFCESVKQGKPCIGICLGLQLLFSESEEGGLFKGLDIIKGKVVRFSNKLKVPHIGWNQIDIKKHNLELFKNVPDGSYVYFVHSYFVVPEDSFVIAATTNYGIDFTSVIAKDNLYGTQFHPEKSQSVGLQILRNFGSLIKKS